MQAVIMDLMSYGVAQSWIDGYQQTAPQVRQLLHAENTAYLPLNAVMPLAGSSMGFVGERWPVPPPPRW